MIIKKCLSTSDFSTAVTALADDLTATGFFSIPTTTQDEEYLHIKFPYNENSWLEIVKPVSQSKISVKIGSTGDEMSTDMYDIGSSYYISYTIVATASAFALAVCNNTSNSEQDRYTNDLSLFITQIGGEKIALTDTYALANGVLYPSNLISPYTGSALNWVQLVPFGSPELGGVSNDVFMIRYTPQVCSEITVGTQQYIFGENLAIKVGVTT